jgi:hypothetical protein
MTDLNNLIERLRQERWCTVEGDENSEEGAEYWPSNWPHEAADALDEAKARERAALDAAHAAHAALQAVEAERDALREVVETIAVKELPSEMEYPMNVGWRYTCEQMILKARSVLRRKPDVHVVR